MNTDFAKKEIKQIFKGYKRMDKRTKIRLIKLGFEITAAGKHYKITHPNSNRMVVIGKTVSDCRAGINTAQYLCCLI